MIRTDEIGEAGLSNIKYYFLLTSIKDVLYSVMCYKVKATVIKFRDLDSLNWFVIWLAYAYAMVNLIGWKLCKGIIWLAF